MKLKKYGFLHKLWLMQWKKDPSNKILYFLNWITLFPIWFVLWGYFALIMSTIGQFRWCPSNQFRFNQWKDNFTKKFTSSYYALFFFYAITFFFLVSISNIFIAYLVNPFVWILIFEFLNYSFDIYDKEDKRKFLIFNRIYSIKLLRKNIEIID